MIEQAGDIEEGIDGDAGSIAQPAYPPLAGTHYP
jgi:hypothetical protein